MPSALPTRRISTTSLSLSCLALLVLAFINHTYAQTPQRQIAPPKKCDFTTSTSDPWDFENSLKDWEKKGFAFNSQPVDGSSVLTDHPSELVKLGGDYWRDLSYPLGYHGKCLIFTEDRLEGSLFSPHFVLHPETPYLNLLIGGSDDLSKARFELQILFNSEGDAMDLVGRIEAWNASEHRSLGDLPRRDDKYVLALAFTGHKGPDKLTLEVLQPETIQLPDFLLGRTAQFRVIDNSPSAHINLDFVRLTQSRDSHRGKVWGYADYHTHPVSHVAFGGVQGIHTVFGKAGTYAADDYYNGKHCVAEDIPYCSNGHDGGPTAEPLINQVEERLKVRDDVSWLRMTASLLWDLAHGRVKSHERSGGPEFKNFPSFLSGAHQQMHITQIRRNYDGGLRLMVAIVTHNRAVEYLMSKLNPDGKVAPPSTDRKVLEAGLKEIGEIVKNNQDWMEIAKTPEEARHIISQNKLAVILGVEVDQLGELNPEKPESAKTEVDYLWRLGIRVVTPIHGTDNRLGGAAVFRDIYNSTNDFLNRGEYNLTVKDLAGFPPRFFQVREGGCWGPLFEQRGECVLFRLANPQQKVVIKTTLFIGRGPYPEPVPAPMYDSFTGHKNVHGLTAYGRDYIEALMKRGMIIDTAHMSDASVQDTFDVIAAHVKQKNSKCSKFGFEPDDEDIPQVCFDDAYPTVISHAHFRAQSFYEEPTLVGLARPSEYQISNRNVRMVQRIGGVIGPFVTEKPLSLPPDQYEAPFKNDCAGSSKGFGYSFRYGLQKMNRQGLGMATDFTFIPGVSPRFGDNACWAFHLAADSDRERKINRHLYNRDAQKDGVVYTTEIELKEKIVTYGRNYPLKPYRMDKRWFDFNVDGLAHFGLIPDMLQDLKNVGLPQKDFEVLFSSAESYLQTWEKSLRVASDLSSRN